VAQNPTAPTEYHVPGTATRGWTDLHAPASNKPCVNQNGLDGRSEQERHLTSGQALLAGSRIRLVEPLLLHLDDESKACGCWCPTRHIEA